MRLSGKDSDVAFVFGAKGQAMRYSELRENVRATAQELRARFVDESGVPRGGVVCAVRIENPVPFLLACLAVLEAGGVLLPLDARLDDASVNAIRERVKPSIVISESAEGQVVFEGTKHERELDPRVSLLLTTSGSSGKAKTVMLTRKGIDANIDAILAYLPITSASRTGLLLPLSYSYSLVGQALTTLAAGGTLVFLYDAGLAPEQLRAIVERDVDGISSVAASLHWLADAALELGIAPKLRYIGSAGAPLSSQTRARLRQAFPSTKLFNQYGLTEASPRVTAVSSDSPAFERGSVGRALAGISLSIRDERQEEVPVGTEGEVFVRGPSVMLGYLDDDEESARVLTPNGLRTGDRARLDEEGHLYVTGRLDDLVNVAGERVSLVGVQNELRAIEGIEDAFVIALPDERLGVKLGAALVLSPGRTLAMVRRSLKDLHPAHKPTRFSVFDRLPTSARGKVDRVAIRVAFETETRITGKE